MSKFVYRQGDVVKVKLDGPEFDAVIQSSEVGPDTDQDGEMVIRYVAQDGTEFTDDKILYLE